MSQAARATLIALALAGLLGGCAGTVDNCPKGLDPPPSSYGSTLPADPGTVKPLN